VNKKYKIGLWLACVIIAAGFAVTLCLLNLWPMTDPRRMGLVAFLGLGGFLLGFAALVLACLSLELAKPPPPAKPEPTAPQNPNLGKVAVVALLCATFATLTPWQPVQARPISLKTPVTLASNAQALTAFLASTGTVLADTTVAQLAADPNAVAILEAAQAAINRAAANAGYDTSDGPFVVSLMPPYGLNPASAPPPGVVFTVYDPYQAQWLAICLGAVIIVIVAGTVYYEFKKWCKRLDDKVISNRNATISNLSQVIIEDQREQFDSLQCFPLLSQ